MLVLVKHHGGTEVYIHTDKVTKLFKMRSRYDNDKHSSYSYHVLTTGDMTGVPEPINVNDDGEYHFVVDKKGFHKLLSKIKPKNKLRAETTSVQYTMD